MMQSNQLDIMRRKMYNINVRKNEGGTYRVIWCLFGKTLFSKAEG